MKLDMRMIGLASVVLLISIVTSLLGDLFFGGIVKTIGDVTCVISIILFVLAFMASWMKKNEPDEKPK
jgi:hypothetical protein